MKKTIKVSPKKGSSSMKINGHTVKKNEKQKPQKKSKKYC